MRERKSDSEGRRLEAFMVFMNQLKLFKLYFGCFCQLTIGTTFLPSSNKPGVQCSSSQQLPNKCVLLTVGAEKGWRHRLLPACPPANRPHPALNAYHHCCTWDRLVAALPGRDDISQKIPVCPATDVLQAFFFWKMAEPEKNRLRILHH